MRAVLCDSRGGPETLRPGEAVEPTPGEGEVLVEVAAAGANFADLLMIAGRYQETPDLPFIPGLEAAGRVVSLGPGVSGPAPGTRVAALVDRGAFAERLTARASDVFAIPDSMGFETAAGFPVVYGSAYGGLVWRAGLAPGELLLVHGAGGGVGLAAVEVGKALGATVIATARGPEKLDLARAHGADHTIDTAPGPGTLRDQVKAIAAGLGREGADVVFDPVGGELFEASLRCVAWGARLVVVGFAAGKVQQIPANLLLVKNVAVTGLYWGSYRRRAPGLLAESFDRLFGWFEAGLLRPHVSQSFALDRAAEALRLLAERKAAGKLVLATGLSP